VQFPSDFLLAHGSSTTLEEKTILAASHVAGTTANLAEIECEFFLDDGDQNIGGNGTPNLGLHRILAGCQVSLDPQVLFDPFERLIDILPINTVRGGCGSR
jgi:hypothetical protein